MRKEKVKNNFFYFLITSDIGKRGYFRDKFRVFTIDVLVPKYKY